MYPANHYMDPYHSHYRNHAPYPYYPPPGWEIPSGHPRPMDSSYCRPPSCGPWPYTAAMHHLHPSELHCCCNRTYPPDYYSYRPPFPQDLPPHLYYHGPFSQHPNACASYSVPSHPYPVDHTPYGYDKFRSHCCGCPNHVCPGAEKSNVKIEEERPDVRLESEQKNADRGSIIRHPNNQYPFIWRPSSNMKGKENEKHYELSPQLLNAWAPVSSKRTGDVKQQEQDNQKEKQFQWPIVWMPAGYDEPKQKAKEMNGTEEIPKAPNISEEAPQSPKIKIIPLSWFENGDHDDQKSAARSGSGDHSDRSAVKNQPVANDHRYGMTLEGNTKSSPTVERKPTRETSKTIPVLPEREVDEKKASTYRTIPVMKERDEKRTGMSEKKEAKEANNAEKVEENRKTKHSDSSTDKRSKLPPVCLRVDPLPRKKSGNGSSRSPSPPTRKDGDKAKKDMEAQSQNLGPKQSDTQKCITVSEEAQSQNLGPKQSDTQKCITVSEVKEKSPEVKKEIRFGNETVQAASVGHSQEEEALTSKDDHKVQVASTMIGADENAGTKSMQRGDVQENAGAESPNGCDKSQNKDGTVIESEAAKDDVRTCRFNLSEPNAAVRIQSAYRGYDVRRWQPLDKLRKIRHVHEQMQGVKKQLQCLEDSCNKPTQKEQVAISETIMNLLLKLDSIQGLHPSVREARKPVARELVCLQEKLDTLCKQPSGELNHRNSNQEESERADNLIQTAAPTVTTEASDREERAIELGKVEELSSADSMEPCDAGPSGVPMQVRPDADTSEQKNEKEESCNTTMNEAQEVPSLMMISDEAFTEQPTDNQERETGESNVISAEQMTEEEKPAPEGEVKEAPLVNSTGPLHDSASSGDSQQEKPAAEGEVTEAPLVNSTGPLHDTASGDYNGLKQRTDSTNKNLCAESNTGFSPASTEDINSNALMASVESTVATEKDGPVDSQVHETSAQESVELKDDVSSAEDDQNKSSIPVIPLENPLVPLKDVEQHDLTPAEDFVVSNAEDQQEVRDISLQVQAVDPLVHLKDVEPDDLTPAKEVLSNTEDQEEAKDISLQVKAVDTMQDSCNVPDGTTEASISDDLELGASADVEKHDQTTLLEPTLVSISAPELTVLDESEDKMRCGVSGKDVDTMHANSGKVPDGTTGASLNDDLELGASADVEKPDQPTLLEPTFESISALLDESDDKMRCGVPGKDELPDMDEKTETSVDKLTRSYVNCADPFCEASRKELDIQESDPSLGAEADNTRGRTVFPDSDSLCAHDGDTTVYEGPGLKVPSNSQIDAQKENISSDVSGTDECTETREVAPVGTEGANSDTEGANSDEGSDLRVSKMDKFNETLKSAPAHARGGIPAEDEASLEEDISVRTENKASEEPASASPAPDDQKVNDEKKLAEENQKLKELLQKLLASGNDQMGVITDLSEKVKALERKLARKKRPKVKVHRPSRHATATVH